MSPLSPVNTHPITSFPRVSGDEPLSVASDAASASFSPRERG